MNYTVGPADWRPWLGGMAWLNLAGLIAFRIGRHVGARGSAAARPPRAPSRALLRRSAALC